LHKEFYYFPVEGCSLVAESSNNKIHLENVSNLFLIIGSCTIVAISQQTVVDDL
jgi:hypothetical protein